MALHRRIVMEGLNLERFVRIAAEAGIELSDMTRENRRLSAVVEVKALATLREMAEKGGWGLRIGALTGSGRWLSSLRMRWLLCVLTVAVTLLCWACSQIMWRIELVDASAYEADIRQALQEMGVSAPMLRSRVQADAIRDALEWRYPEIAWVECGWQGTTLVIRVVQGNVVRSGNNVAGPCDIVASRDGVVYSIVTRAGTPVVKVGEVVQEGQVLIKGEERTSGGDVNHVAARGTVMARVWLQAAVKTQLRQIETTYTGATYASQMVVSPWFALWNPEPSGFATADASVITMPIGGLFIPLQMVLTTFNETDLRSIMTDYRSVLSENNRAALLKLQEIAGGEESLVDNWVNWSIIEDEILLSVATGEMLVDIAQQERSSGMAATE